LCTVGEILYETKEPSIPYFKEVLIKDVQELANKGEIVIAAYKNPMFGGMRI